MIKRGKLDLFTQKNLQCCMYECIPGVGWRGNKLCMLEGCDNTAAPAALGEHSWEHLEQPHPWLGGFAGALAAPRGSGAVPTCPQCAFPGVFMFPRAFGARLRGSTQHNTIAEVVHCFCTTPDGNFNAWLQITNVFCCGTLIKLLLPASALCGVKGPAPPPRHSDANGLCAGFP